ncbi:MAG: hypothetical protein Kow0068_13820 [Marinilabiliales bacterium]
MELEQNGYKIVDIGLGFVKLIDDNLSNEKLEKVIEEAGFELVIDRESQIVEQIKIAVIELIHHLNNVDSIIRKSDYLVEKLGLSYQQLSKIFSKKEGITLEKYIIAQKIERIKELILRDEYTLSEIAYMMDYSSVQYLSNQFKNFTGMSVTEYKQSELPLKKPINKLF